jgi:hypothetical protein
VAAVFAEEKPFLQALPLEPFRYYQYGERTVHLGRVEVEAAYYGAPPGWIGRKVNVQWDAMFIRLLDPRTGELLREYLSGKRGGHRIRDSDRPRRTPPQLLQLLARAHKAGPNIGAVCDAIHARQGRAQRCGVEVCALSALCALWVEVCALSALSAISAGFAGGRAGFGILWPGPEGCGPSSPGGGSPVDQAEFQQLLESKIDSFFADMAMEKSANLHSG